MPPMLQALVHRLVRWRVLPRAMAPDSAIINIYDQVSNSLETICEQEDTYDKAN